MQYIIWQCGHFSVDGPLVTDGAIILVGFVTTEQRTNSMMKLRGAANNFSRAITMVSGYIVKVSF